MSRQPEKSLERTSDFLVATTPITAHTLNASKFVAHLVSQGHRVWWWCGADFQSYVRDLGAIPLRMSSACDYSIARAASYVRGSSLSAVARVRRLYHDLIVGRAGAQCHDLLRIIQRIGPQAILSDTLLLGARPAAHLSGVPWATFGDGPLLWSDEDTPPFGAGLKPMAGRAGRHRNRNVQSWIDNRVFGSARAHYNKLCARMGVEPVPNLRMAGLSPRLHLQGCAPSFEYPRSNLPDSVRFVGVLGTTGVRNSASPGSAASRGRGSRPLAFVTQGTVRPDLSELALPATRALVREGYDVLVTAAGRANEWRHEFATSPEGGIVVVDRIDYAEALAAADLLVTNGGYTGVTMALHAGVPVIQCGATEEKADIGARLEWAGVGVAVRRTRAQPRTIRLALGRLLGQVGLQSSLERMSAEFRAHRADELGGRLLENMAKVA
ncbi:glycosyltransferase [Granulicoccus sp. GXG6511]|uniref:glycosyltransferase n=1 Tax=Granulicoccus sp. GXG6511 TaxID=3381351 RepID=UPI003D7E7B05